MKWQKVISTIHVVMEASFCGDLGFDSRKFVINNETRRVWPEKVVFGKKWCLTQTPLPHTHGF